jgi:hypothetical protein
MALQKTPLTSVLVSWEETAKIESSFRSCEYHTSIGNKEGYPTFCISEYPEMYDGQPEMFNVSPRHPGQWQLRLRKLLVEFKEKTDDFFALSTNYVQHRCKVRESRVTIFPKPVPQTLDVVHLKSEKDEKVSAVLGSAFFLVNNAEPMIQVFIDNVASNDAKKSAKSLFKNVHVVIDYQRA